MVNTKGPNAMEVEWPRCDLHEPCIVVFVPFAVGYSRVQRAKGHVMRNVGVHPTTLVC